MNVSELQTIRHIFAVTVEESARYIARDNNVTAQQQWEKSEREVPKNIIRICLEMKARRKLRTNTVIDKMNNCIDSNTVRFFPGLNALQAVYYHGGFLDWKIYQSAIVELHAYDLERIC